MIQNGIQKGQNNCALNSGTVMEHLVKIRAVLKGPTCHLDSAIAPATGLPPLCVPQIGSEGLEEPAEQCTRRTEKCLC